MGQCLTPYWKKDSITLKEIPFPCGKCYDCLSRRVSGWSFRLMKEEERSCSSFFVTFTFNTDHVDITKNGFMTLSKRPWQLYMKRLRQEHKLSENYDPNYPIRYYLCGEYGGRTMRPHYHAIMFNVDIALVEKVWHYGKIHVGAVSGASVGYTLKYMMKRNKIPQHRNDDRLKEFQLCSKGLGSNYRTLDTLRWHQNDP